MHIKISSTAVVTIFIIFIAALLTAGQHAGAEGNMGEQEQPSDYDYAHKEEPIGWGAPPENIRGDARSASSPTGGPHAGISSAGDTGAQAGIEATPSSGNSTDDYRTFDGSVTGDTYNADDVTFATAEESRRGDGTTYQPPATPARGMSDSSFAPLYSAQTTERAVGWRAGMRGPVVDEGGNWTTGARGQTGTHGDKGMTGDTGPTGPKGEKGTAGERGQPGNKGDKGETGHNGSTGTKGDAGQTGETGPAGTKGDSGTPGAVGSTGPAGAKGEPCQNFSSPFKCDAGRSCDAGPTGAQGLKGEAGETGPTGAKGDAGRTGETGPTGAKGDSNGPRGETGPAGPRGSGGETGPQGPTGTTGDKGDKGEGGLVGPTGPRGPAGAIGEKGERGERGPIGEPGSDGVSGVTGPSGSPGAAGHNGSSGATGPSGPEGRPGAAGPTGPTGLAGSQGSAGEAGQKGERGDRGADGPPGMAGLTGAQGPTGPRGETGAKGDRGLPGSPADMLATSSGCDAPNNGGCSQRCVGTSRGHYCTCYAGFQLVAATAQDPKTCGSAAIYCDQQANGEKLCYCSADGVTRVLNGTACADVDECLVGGGPCEHTCTNTIGSYSCGCRPGYRLTPAGTCADIDECDDGSNGGCAGACINYPGAYYCSCAAGWTRQPTPAVIFPTRRNAVCFAEDMRCKYVAAGQAPECYCPVQNDSSSPWRIQPTNGTLCAKSSPCSVQNGGCHQLCNDSTGFVKCSCRFGFVLSPDQVTCDDVNECRDSTFVDQSCPSPGICINTAGSFMCLNLLHMASARSSLIGDQQEVASDAQVLKSSTPLSAFVGLITLAYIWLSRN